MMHSHRRHDISDEVWSRLEVHLPGRQGSWGGIARDNRQFINAVFWIMRTGAPWRDLPPDYGDWSNTHRRFIRWRDKGMWERLLEVLIDDPGLRMAGDRCQSLQGSSPCHRGQRRKSDMSRTKGGSTARYIWPWMRMVCR